jgi:integrase
VTSSPSVTAPFRSTPWPLAETASPSFVAAMEDYFDVQADMKAASSLQTERVHLRHLQRALGPKVTQSVNQILTEDLERFIRQRLKEVDRTTVKKERQTLAVFFAWLVARGDLRANPCAALPRFKAGKQRGRFRTLAEIEEILDRGGLSEAEVGELSKCLYLAEAETAEILGLVRDWALHDFIHPMFAVAAYTGMRRGEILRLRWMDVNFRQRLITARSLKQSRQVVEVAREIDLHPELAEVLEAYRMRRARGSTFSVRRTRYNL